MKLKRLSVTVAVVAALLGTAACGNSGGDPLATTDSNSSDSGGGGITVGSADFPESALLAEIYAGALEAKGVKGTGLFLVQPQETRATSFTLVARTEA